MNHIKLGVLTLCMIASGAAFAAPVGVTIDTTKPGPVINKNIYGQFAEHLGTGIYEGCLLYTSPSPRDRTRSRMPSSA